MTTTPDPKIRITRDQANWLLQRLGEYRTEAMDERRSTDTDSDVLRYTLAKFEGFLQAMTGDWQ